MPSGFKTTERPSMYQPLVDLLAASDDDEVVLTFSEIGAIIGRPLSVSALIDADMWHKTRQPQVRRWRAIGWRARFDRRNTCVHFTREE